MNKVNIIRRLELPNDHSLILFGPRGAGKSTLLKQQFGSIKTLWINLLLSKEEEKYSRNPDNLISIVKSLPDDHLHIVIDEIQKIPKLLDIVHELIESTDKIFILSGSSARKLKKGSANLLAGRAFVYNLFPFTFAELGPQFDLQQALSFGLLPKIYQLKSELQKEKFLKAYANTYLKEEVWSEQFIRDLTPFRSFLEVAAISNGKIINFSNIARDINVDYKTVENYYSILDDTLVGFFLYPYNGSIRRQISKSPKFYFFDVGVTRALARMLSVVPREKTSYYGELFEQFIICEIRKFIAYFHDEYKMSFLCDKNGQEIDVIVQRPNLPTLLIEIKSTDDVQKYHLSNIINLKVEFTDYTLLCFSQDKNKKIIDEVSVWPWQEGIIHYFI